MEIVGSIVEFGLYGVGVGGGLLFLVIIAKALVHVARPNEVLIFSGMRHKLSDGTVQGYRVVRTGQRAFRVPVLQQVARMDMTLQPIVIQVHNAYSKGNIPLQINAVANVKIDSNPRFLPNAIERFLGKPPAEIRLVAQQTLEGALREVLAQLTPEEVNEDRLAFAEKLIESAEDDMNKLGLGLDTFKIQHVADDTGYLDSLGRPRIAAVKRDAEKAEDQAKRAITRAQAEAGRIAEVAKADSEKATLQKQNELRRIEAELNGSAESVEREAAQAAKTARAQADRELQTIRAELVERAQQADVVIPANINRQAKELLAKGEAAPTEENGAAVVQVLESMSKAWESMGPQAREIYVIQHLEEIIGTVVGSLDNVSVGEVNVLDRGDGEALAGYAATYPRMVSAVLSALGESTGVDVPAILRGEQNGSSNGHAASGGGHTARFGVEGV